jgi:polygalacturonase
MVTDYGAVGDGRTDDHAAIMRAISVCADTGGGRVVVPPGDYLTGPLHLRSFVNLHVGAGATLRFITDSCRYLPPVLTRWEGIECMGLSPLIYAFEQEHVAVTGDGVLDGQAGSGRWWNWAGPWEGALSTGWTPGQPHQAAARDRLHRWAESGIPVGGRILTERDLLRPMFVQFYRCHDVLVEGITVRNTPMWGIHPVLCRAVTVRRVQVISHGPNNDGCVPDSCRDILVEDCRFDTGDDCVAIKAGRNRDGWRVNTPAEDMVIRGCRMRGGHSAVAIGSEISGHIRRIFVEGCTLDGAQLDHVVRIKANSTRGGIVEQIYLRDITASRAREAAVRVDLRYDEVAERGDHWPQVQDVAIERLGCEHSGRAIWIEGLPAIPVRDVRIKESIFHRVDAANILRHVAGFTARGVVFPAPF